MPVAWSATRSRFALSFMLAMMLRRSMATG